jgi:hypothetical protein
VELKMAIDLSCPHIDSVLRALNDASSLLRSARKGSEDRGTISDIERAEIEIDGCAFHLERVRSINAQLRYSADSLQEIVDSYEQEVTAVATTREEK